MALNLAALAFFGLCWGLSVPLSKHAVSAGHHPLGMIIWQLSAVVIVFGAYGALKATALHHGRHHVRYLLLIIVLGTLVPNTLSLLALAQLPAGIMALVIATVPIFSLLIALLIKIEVFSFWRMLGVVAGVASLVLIAMPESALPDPAAAPWILVGIIAPLCYAIEGNYVAIKAPKDLSAMATLFGASLIGLIVLWPIVYLNGWQVPVWVVWDSSRWAMLGAAGGHMIAYTGYLWLLGRAGAVFTSQVAYIVTLTGVITSIVFLGERYGALLWIAVALMLLALALVKPVNKSGAEG